jgi:hypothetical protein
MSEKEAKKAHGAGLKSGWKTGLKNLGNATKALLKRIVSSSVDVEKLEGILKDLDRLTNSMVFAVVSSEASIQAHFRKDMSKFSDVMDVKVAKVKEDTQNILDTLHVSSNLDKMHF